MKIKSPFLLLFVISSAVLSAQNIQTEVIETNSGRGAERVVIKVSFEGKSDSIKPLTIEGQRLHVDNRSTSMSIKNGEKRISGSVSFSFRPARTGTFEFEGPVVYIDGRMQQGKAFSFQVDDIIEMDELSEVERAALKWPFTLDNHTYRLTLNEDHGILEKRLGEEWLAIKNLDAEACGELIEIVTREE